MDLEDTMASLQINDQTSEPPSEETDSQEPPRRSSRSIPRVDYTEKRRVSTRPIKISKDGNVKDADNYYLDKRIKRRSPELETIYEDKNEECMSSKKFHRVINFNPSEKNVKLKKSKMKAKSMSAQQRAYNKKKIALSNFLEELERIAK